MSSIPIPNGVRVEMIYLNASQRMENVYHVTKGSPATLANLQTLWTYFRDWDGATIKAHRALACSLVLIKLTATDGPGAPVYEAAVSPAVAGTLAGVALPNTSSIAVKHTTGKQGRSYRGRTYVCGLSAGSLQNSDTILATHAANFVAWFTTMRTGLAAIGWTFCIASLYSGVVIVNGKRRAVPRNEGILTAVTGSSMELGIDTQRHRKMPYQV